MTNQRRAEAKKRAQMLAELRKQHPESVKASQAALKKQQSLRKTIRQALQDEPLSVPQIAAATHLPASEVLWHIAAMKKYGAVVEAGLDEDYEYYLYKLAEEA